MIRWKNSVTWFEAGGKLTPLVINDPKSKLKIIAFESQWDLFALLEFLNWHKGNNSDFGFIATRGAMTGSRIAPYCNREAIVYAFTQNDDPGQQWENKIIGAVKCEVRKAVIPQQYKDLNDWAMRDKTLKDGMLGSCILKVAKISIKRMPFKSICGYPRKT